VGLLRSKRLRWVGHCLRRDADDASRVAVIRELEDNSSGPWSQIVGGDLVALGWSYQDLVRLAGQRVVFNNLTEARTLSIG
jgi:hypothetical protein